MKRKKSKANILLVLIIIIGVGLLTYPSISDYWNRLHQSRAIAAYTDVVSQMDTSEMDDYFEEARAYNEELANKPMSFALSDSELAQYNSVLDVTGSGAMSYIEIEKINCYLPIYHGVDDSVLSVAVGHIPGSSLPVGGESTHCVLSGHRGLPSAKLFTDLDQLVEGDTFVIHTLNEIYTYKVDQIRIVLPSEVDNLEIVEGEDYCTLVTCTPYGINTHRLLVRGSRTENAVTINVDPDAMQVNPYIVALCIGIPITLILFILALITKVRK